MIPVKAYIALAVLIAVAVLQVWLIVHVRNSTHAKDVSEELAAVIEHDKQTAARAIQDRQDATDAIEDLKQQLASARGELSALPPPRPIRLCNASGGDAGRPESASAAGAQPAEPAGRGDDPGVLPGDRPGPDVATDVRALAAAGVILAKYNRALTQWAVEQSQPVRPQ